MRTSRTKRRSTKTFFPAIYDSWDTLQREKFQQILEKLGKEFASDLKKKRILDIGAGAGYLEDFLAGKNIPAKNVIAIEPDRKMLKSTRNFVLGKAEEMPFRKGSFDAAFILDAIHLLNFDGECLKKNGIIIVSLFCNDENTEEKRGMIAEKLKGFAIQTEFVTDTKEKEIVIVARKK